MGARRAAILSRAGLLQWVPCFEGNPSPPTDQFVLATDRVMGANCVQNPSLTLRCAFFVGLRPSRAVGQGATDRLAFAGAVDAFAPRDAPL